VEKEYFAELFGRKKWNDKKKRILEEGSLVIKKKDKRADGIGNQFNRKNWETGRVERIQ
jgi:Family of unknown function (DUF5641)